MSFVPNKREAFHHRTQNCRQKTRKTLLPNYLVHPSYRTSGTKRYLLYCPDPCVHWLPERQPYQRVCVLCFTVNCRASPGSGLTDLKLCYLFPVSVCHPVFPSSDSCIGQFWNLKTSKQQKLWILRLNGATQNI